MKRFYEAPDAEVINLAAMQSIALLDGHPDEGVAAANDEAPDAGFSWVPGRPGQN